MIILIKTTSDSIDVCNAIANEVLHKSLSPCTQIYSVSSKFKWKKEIINNKEYVIEIKTIKKYQNKIASIIEKNHNYDIPEIISMKINILNDNYKDWFDKNI